MVATEEGLLARRALHDQVKATSDWEYGVWSKSKIKSHVIKNSL